VIANAQVVALGIDIGVDDLVVEKLRGLRLARNAPVVVVHKAPKEPELSLLIQNLDFDEIAELAFECLDALFEPCYVALDLCPQQLLHGAIAELRLQFVDRSGRIA
jgi:hypothetical protein